MSCTYMVSVKQITATVIVKFAEVRLYSFKAIQLNK